MLGQVVFLLDLHSGYIRGKYQSWKCLRLGRQCSLSFAPFAFISIYVAIIKHMLLVFPSHGAHGGAFQRKNGCAQHTRDKERDRQPPEEVSATWQLQILKAYDDHHNICDEHLKNHQPQRMR